METIQGGGETQTRASSAGAGDGVPLPTAPPFVQEETRPRRRRLIAISVIAVMTTISVGLAFLANRPDGTDTATGRGTPVTIVQSTSSASPSSAAEMLRRVLPSVVNVRVTQTVEDPFFGGRSETAEGSGVVLSRDGMIVTNSHVVEDASSVEVEFTDGHDSITATIEWTDPNHDLALIKVDASDLTPITVGDSEELRFGDRVYAIGFPLDLGPTVTEGIVSGADRTIDVQDGTGTRHLTGLLQTDAAINHGNSGGALVNSAGELVGIPTAAVQASSAENVGFAISSDAAIAAARQLASAS